MSESNYRVCVRDALNCMYDQLVNVICVDDNCEPDEYSDWQLVSEAIYQRSLYFESGTLSNMTYRGDDGKDAQKDAKKHVRQLSRFIDKWTPTLDREPNPTGCGEPEYKNDPIRKNEFFFEF